MTIEDRTIDLTVPIPPQLRVLLVILGIVHVIGGALFLSTGHGFFGVLNLVLGPSWLSWGLFYDRINRHAVVIHEGHLKISRGLFRSRRIAVGIDFRDSCGRDWNGDPGKRRKTHDSELRRNESCRESSDKKRV